MQSNNEQNKRGGFREGAGRPKQEGDRHTYTIADDVHKWIMAHGGGKYITDTIRIIIATQGK